MDRPQPTNDRPDRGRMLIAAAIIGSAFVLSWGMSISQPHYQLAASGDMIARMDTDSGELIACNRQGCVRLQPPDREKFAAQLTGKPASNPALPATQTLQNSVAR